MPTPVADHQFAVAQQVVGEAEARREVIQSFGIERRGPPAAAIVPQSPVFTLKMLKALFWAPITPK